MPAFVLVSIYCFEGHLRPSALAMRHALHQKLERTPRRAHHCATVNTLRLSTVQNARITVRAKCSPAPRACVKHVLLIHLYRLPTPTVPAKHLCGNFPQQSRFLLGVTGRRSFWTIISLGKLVGRLKASSFVLSYPSPPRRRARLVLKSARDAPTTYTSMKRSGQ